MVKALLGQKVSLPEKIVYEWYREAATDAGARLAEVIRLRERCAYLTRVVDHDLLMRVERMQAQVTQLRIRDTQHRLDALAQQAAIDSLLEQLRMRASFTGPDGRLFVARPNG
jgi:hypothetical protein